MKKVCFIISGFAYSGAEIVLERYINNNMDIDPYFIIIYDNKKVIDLFISEYGNDKVKTLNIVHSKLRLHLCPLYDIECINRKLINVVNSINPDVIYANNTMELWLINKYIRNTRIKSIGHIHDMRESIRNPIRRWSIAKSVNFYDEILTVSEATKKSWQIENSHIIYNGIDSKNFIEDDKQIKKVKKLGFIGSISERKGVDLLIDKLDHIFSMNYILKIAYSNIENKNLIKKLQYYKKIYPNKLYLYENLFGDEVIKFYDNIDLLVVPSRHDPLPTVVLEAMSRRTLVLGSDVDGIPEMIRDKEFLFDINSDCDMMSKLEHIKTYPVEKLNEIREYQYQYCKNRFNSNLKVEKVNKIISKLSSK